MAQSKLDPKSGDSDDLGSFLLEQAGRPASLPILAAAFSAKVLEIVAEALESPEKLPSLEGDLEMARAQFLAACSEVPEDVKQSD